MAGCIRDVDLDRVGRDFMRSRRQEKQRAAEDEKNEDDKNYGSHRPFRFDPWNGALLPDLQGECIALSMTKFSGRLDRPIVLVGLMGAGKSTVGRRLARRLGLPFIDSDQAIEDAAGFSAGELFERFGDADFRDGERRLVARLIDGTVRVIATGGGAYVDPRTRKLLNERAITVWLDAPVDVLAERTGRRNTRPLLRRGNRTGTLERLAQERGAAYSEAHIRVRSGEGAHKDVVDAIVAALETYVTGAAPGPSSGSGPEANERSSPA
jgi:shikimate kinase